MTGCAFLWLAVCVRKSAAQDPPPFRSPHQHDDMHHVLRLATDQRRSGGNTPNFHSIYKGHYTQLHFIEFQRHRGPVVVVVLVVGGGIGVVDSMKHNSQNGSTHPVVVVVVPYPGSRDQNYFEA